MVTALPRAAADFHTLGKKGWLAGSIARDELPGSRATGVEVICVCGAACEPSEGLLRVGTVRSDIIRGLVAILRTKL